MTQSYGLLDEIKYSLHIIFHPFDGFWDMKHEKRGSVRAALIMVAILIVVFCAEEQFTGYYFSSEKSKGLLIQISSVVLPFFIWCVANWSITTLMDGKGNFTDIVMASGYALTPMVLIHIPLTVISNILSSDSIAFYTIFSTLAIIWSVWLMLVAIMNIHQFTATKAFFTCILAIVGMAVIVFLVVLFLTIIQQVYDLFYTVWREVILRL